MPVEEELVEDGVIVHEGFSKSRQPGSRYLFQGGFVGLVSYAANVQHDPVVDVRHGDTSFTDHNTPTAGATAASESSQCFRRRADGATLERMKKMRGTFLACINQVSAGK